MLRGITLVVMLLIVACSGTMPRVTRDGTPPPIDASQVIDAVPRPDPILAQGNKSPYTVNGVTYRILASAAGYKEEGLASWYGTKFDGRQTSNGEIFDVYAATAAHKTLPLPSYVRVTHLDNGRSIIVRVNDRGPFHSKRIIDLSYGAAVKLGYADQGTARVRVEIIDLAGVDDRRNSDGSTYRNLQLGAFSEPDAAQRLAAQVSAVISIAVYVSPVDTPGGRLYRLRAGPFMSEKDLRSAQKTLQSAGFSPGQPLP
ncbi:septal ring lytic transglycosylase RlpA family protein [Paraglaciecola sp.]|nr:septal ring lytic transglycosylase RlpA family protein [Paraglaciecola sp.]MDB4281667.1 septal ring lytic transglycosylase RlpA family protein [Paraglaciecola sp.]